MNKNPKYKLRKYKGKLVSVLFAFMICSTIMVASSFADEVEGGDVAASTSVNIEDRKLESSNNPAVENLNISNKVNGDSLSNTETEKKEEKEVNSDFLSAEGKTNKEIVDNNSGYINAEDTEKIYDNAKKRTKEDFESESNLHKVNKSENTKPLYRFAIKNTFDTNDNNDYKINVLDHEAFDINNKELSLKNLIDKNEYIFKDTKFVLNKDHMFADIKEVSENVFVVYIKPSSFEKIEPKVYDKDIYSDVLIHSKVVDLDGNQISDMSINEFLNSQIDRNNLNKIVRIDKVKEYADGTVDRVDEYTSDGLKRNLSNDRFVDMSNRFNFDRIYSYDNKDYKIKNVFSNINGGSKGLNNEDLKNFELNPYGSTFFDVVFERLTPLSDEEKNSITNNNTNDGFEFIVGKNSNANLEGFEGINYVTFKGYVFEDLNNNGIKDDNEIGIPNIKLNLAKPKDSYISIHSMYDGECPSIMTDDNGYYEITIKNAGSMDSFSLVPVIPNGYKISDKNFVNKTVDSNKIVSSYNPPQFGLDYALVDTGVDNFYDLFKTDFESSHVPNIMLDENSISNAKIPVWLFSANYISNFYGFEYMFDDMDYESYDSLRDTLGIGKIREDGKPELFLAKLDIRKLFGNNFEYVTADNEGLYGVNSDGTIKRLFSKEDILYERVGKVINENGAYIIPVTDYKIAKHKWSSVDDTYKRLVYVPNFTETDYIPNISKKEIIKKVSSDGKFTKEYQIYKIIEDAVDENGNISLNFIKKYSANLLNDNNVYSYLVPSMDKQLEHIEKDFDLFVRFNTFIESDLWKNNEKRVKELENKILENVNVSYNPYIGPVFSYKSDANIDEIKEIAKELEFYGVTTNFNKYEFKGFIRNARLHFLDLNSVRLTHEDKSVSLEKVKGALESNTLDFNKDISPFHLELNEYTASAAGSGSSSDGYNLLFLYNNGIKYLINDSIGLVPVDQNGGVRVFYRSIVPEDNNIEISNMEINKPLSTKVGVDYSTKSHVDAKPIIEFNGKTYYLNTPMIMPSYSASETGVVVPGWTDITYLYTLEKPDEPTPPTPPVVPEDPKPIVPPTPNPPSPSMEIPVVPITPDDDKPKDPEPPVPPVVKEDKPIDIGDNHDGDDKNKQHDSKEQDEQHLNKKFKYIEYRNSQEKLPQMGSSQNGIFNALCLGFIGVAGLLKKKNDEE